MSLFNQDDPDILTSNTGDPASFAYSTIRERWPKILSTACETVEGKLDEDQSLPSDDVSAGREIVQKIKGLRSALASDASLAPIPNDGDSDVKDWNAELEGLSGMTWQKAPWLYSECYMYRLLHTYFTQSRGYWRSFDVFHVQKTDSLTKSKRATLELAARVLPIFQSNDIASHDAETQKALFEEVLQISLWGNATDLSLLTTITLDELQSRQGKAAREASKANVLADDTEAVWRHFSSRQGKTGNIHIVLDNAGFELLTDLVLAGYLLKAGFASKIVLHGKRMPWFVSDVNPRDFDDLVQGLANGTYWEGELSSEETQHLQGMGNFLQEMRDSKRLEAQYHPFWTTQHSFGRLHAAAPELYENLAAADLVVFKGDLNYRKLVYDGLWPKTTPFRKAIGPLAKPETGLKTLALRTAKADVCVGLQHGVEEKLEKNWAWTGKYGIISYCHAQR